MEEEPIDRWPSDTKSQVSGPVSDSSEGQTVEWPVMPAAIPMEIWPPNFNGEGDLANE